MPNSRGIYGSPSNNVTVRAQGYIEHELEDNNMDIAAADILKILRPDGTRPRIVLGAGSVHPRKGVDLFLQTAAALKSKSDEDVCFNLGRSRISTKRRYQLRHLAFKATWSRMDLEKTVFFFPHQADLSTLFMLADVFFLSSRMDPYPNVVIDALKYGKPVVCFARSTGAEELFENKQAFGHAVPYADVFAAADAIRELLRAPNAAAKQNQRLVASKFNFRSYANFIADQLEQARSSRQEMISAYKLIRLAESIDPEFYNGDPVVLIDRHRCIKHFVALASKGLALNNPRPGLSAYHGSDNSIGDPGSAHNTNPREWRFDLEPQDKSAKGLFCLHTAKGFSRLYICTYTILKWPRNSLRASITSKCPSMSL